MELKALNVCYNSIYMCLSLVSIFNFYFNHKNSSLSNCHSRHQKTSRWKKNVLFSNQS
jgi:hypothetical protein